MPTPRYRLGEDPGQLLAIQEPVADLVVFPACSAAVTRQRGLDVIPECVRHIGDCGASSTSVISSSVAPAAGASSPPVTLTPSQARQVPAAVIGLVPV